MKEHAVAAPEPRFAEVCPFRIRRDRGEFLLLRRAPEEPVYPGLCELREETGAVPAGFWVVPAVSAFYDASADAIRSVALFAAQLEEEAGVRLSSEHDAFLWLTAADARRKLVWPGQRTCLDVVEQYILGGEEAGRLLALPL